MDPARDGVAWRCAAGAVAPGRALKLEIDGAGGILVNHDGRHYAYVNRCPHAGTPLDRRPSDFFTEDRRLLRCATHGAVFAPDTGVCVQGPCPGARLDPLWVERDGGDLVVRRWR